MRVEEADISPDGVYTGHLVITGGQRTRLPAAISVCCNPTFAGPRRTIEAHVLDLDGVTPDMAIWREEVFGPALAVRRVSGFDAAVEAVNDSVDGLSAAVVTPDVGLAHRFTELAEAGQVSVHLPTSGRDVHHPFGGFGDSGSPFKEQGLEGLRFYTRVKTVAMGHSVGGAR